jgi:hypothetical protein
MTNKPMGIPRDIAYFPRFELFRRTHSLSGSTPSMSALAGGGQVIDGHALYGLQYLLPSAARHSHPGWARSD